MNIENILFTDIETVPQSPDYESLSSDCKELWKLKAQSIMRNKEDITPEIAYKSAGLYAEFGKIICISCGYIQVKDEATKLTIKSICGDNETKLLTEFAAILNKFSSNGEKFLCAHNGKEFDFPYICRRMIINGVKLPDMLLIAGKKPWEIRHLDTMEMWKFGDFKSHVSLKLLAHVLGIPSPKDDIDGSMVSTVYYEEKNIDRIATYCQKDVATLAQVYLKLQNIETIPAEHITLKPLCYC